MAAQGFVGANHSGVSFPKHAVFGWKTVPEIALLDRSWAGQIERRTRALAILVSDAIREQAGHAVEFDCHANELRRLQDQMFNVLKGDVLGQIPDPHPFRHRRDVDDAVLLKRHQNR
ncbi:hypothetical protein NKI20_29525 [Mesorhizobium sp. M0830]|uniref:hypothetical protein n=1 Tax=Mesorhizobium sp. M0830 TaxID=2957008 RepID=UPI003339188B